MDAKTSHVSKRRTHSSSLEQMSARIKIDVGALWLHVQRACYVLPSLSSRYYLASLDVRCLVPNVLRHLIGMPTEVVIDALRRRYLWRYNEADVTCSRMKSDLQETGQRPHTPFCKSYLCKMSMPSYLNMIRSRDNRQLNSCLLTSSPNRNTCFHTFSACFLRLA